MATTIAGNQITNNALGFDGVNIYSVDGSGNNLASPTVGEAGGDEARVGPANYATTGTQTPIDGPNPRAITQAIMSNDQNLNDPGGRSAYEYAFGQFVDHDIDRTPDDGATLSFAVPTGDSFFSPGTNISIIRGDTDPANGDALNAVTTYLDLSQVYGSDAATAASLRGADGTMAVSEGRNLPIVNGQYLGGDIRATENPDLTSIDTLFVREHNYWVATLKAQDPTLTGDQLYSMARSITTAEYQNITYSEFLPSLLGTGALSAYQGYQPSVSPAILEEFSTSAYRFGHSIISTTETKIGNDGTALQAQDLIAASQEGPGDFSSFGGADALLRNLSQDFSQKEGVSINSDLLNLLNAGADSMDLGAIDIERERDLGIGSLNQVRMALGLTPYTSFSDVTSNATLAANLKSVYGTIDQLDLFVGGLAEDAVSGSMVGSTFQALIVMQFEHLRDGDRLFYENQGFSAAMMQKIQSTTLSDVILRNTDTTAVQQQAFVETIRHSSDVASSNIAAPQLVIGVNTDGALIKGEADVTNTLVAGTGANQVMTGGGPLNTFEFLGSGHTVTVTDFSHGNSFLDFENAPAALTASDVVVTTDANGSAVVHANGNTITLTGVTAAQLSINAFEFDQTTTGAAAPPKLDSQTDDLRPLLGAAFSTALSSAAFVDPNGGTITLTATQADGTPLPSWVTFNPATNVLSGTAPATVGVLNLVVTATASDGQSAQEGFKIYSSAAPPALVAQTADVRLTAGQNLSDAIPDATFMDPAHGTMTYTATQEDGTALPSWLTFDATTEKFSGVMPAGATSLGVVLNATTSVGSTTGEEFHVYGQPQSPTFILQTADIRTTGNQTVSEALAPGTFTDPAGGAISYALSMADKSTLPSWITYSASTGLISVATPDALGTQHSLGIVVTGTTALGGTASEAFHLYYGP